MNNLLKQSKIMLVDDHAMIREGMKFLLAAHPDLEVCGEASSVDEAMAMVKNLRPDLVVVDISLKDSHGIDLLAQIKRFDSKIKTLVSTTFKESVYAERAFRAGASGYLNKQESPEKCVEAIRCVLSGQRYMSAAMTQRLVNQAVGQVDAQEQSPVDKLSNRELEVFRMIGEGINSGKIANKLHLSTHTIDTHREKIKAKLQLANGGELQREAIQWVLENG